MARISKSYRQPASPSEMPIASAGATAGHNSSTLEQPTPADANSSRDTDIHVKVITRELSSEEKTRLWEHTLHQDELLTSRLNFFLIFESVLLGIVGVIYSKPASAGVALKALVILGLALTLVWAYIQAKQKYIFFQVWERAKANLPEFKETLQMPDKWPISINWLLAYIVPSLVGLIWIVLLVAVFVGWI